MTLLINSAEGGTSGTAVTLGNSGGASGTAFDVVTAGTGATLAFDGAHVHAGGLSYQFATGTTAANVNAQWTTSLGSSLATVWFRLYGYFTANPAVKTPVCVLRSGTTLASQVSVSTAGKIVMSASASGTNVIASTNSIPLGAWWRLEGFVTGSATAGQVEFRLFLAPDAAAPDETQTSSTAQNTAGLLSRIDFGNSSGAVASMGPYWLDDLGASTTAYIGVSAPAAFPSVLRTSGQHLVDANGSVMPLLKGLVMQPAGQAVSWYTDAYTEGARILRTVVFWGPSAAGAGNGLQPYGNGSHTGFPASGTDFSGIDTATYVPKLDAHIANCLSAGLYTVLTFYLSPQNTHSPGWTAGITGGGGGGPSNMGNYVSYGQSATNYLAQRYGDPADPQGFWAGSLAVAAGSGGTFKPVVIGMGLNEITPDSTTASTWLINLVTQQATSMTTWMRAYAPNWIQSVCCGFGMSEAEPNALGSGHNVLDPGGTGDQTFTSLIGSSAATALATAGGNWAFEAHDYLMATTDGTNGRQSSGLNNNAVTIKTDKTTNAGGENYTTYPPTTGSVLLTQPACRAIMAKYLASYKVACAALNVPLLIGEFGWAPLDNATVPATTFTGGPAWIADKMAAWSNLSPVAEIEWDYQKNQGTDPWAAEPGTPLSGATGSDVNGWQTVTNLFFAGGVTVTPAVVSVAVTEPAPVVTAAGGTVTVTPAVVTVTVSEPAPVVTAAPGLAITTTVLPPAAPGVPYTATLTATGGSP